MRLPFGLSIDFAWTHCNGESSKTSMLLCARHPRSSITWTWALYWTTPRGLYRTRPGRFIWQRFKLNSSGSFTVGCHGIGALTYSWQDFMPWPTPEERKRRDEAVEGFYSPVPDYMPEEWQKGDGA